MNDIIISFDQQRAVRVKDGLQLVAVPEYDLRQCLQCVAPESMGSCTCGMARTVRGCTSDARKDKRNIIWRPA